MPIFTGMHLLLPDLKVVVLLKDQCCLGVILQIGHNLGDNTS